MRNRRSSRVGRTRAGCCSTPSAGCARAQAIRRSAGAPEIIVLTTFDTDDHVVRALRAGASGFLLKDTPPAEIAHAITRVAGGEPMLSATVTRRLMARVAADDTGARRERACQMVNQLTPREREVALAIGRGASNAEISAALYMSVATVKAHVSRMLTKLGLTNRVQLALLVHDAGAAESSS